MTAAREKTYSIQPDGRLGLSRDEAAFYIHVAVPTFNRMVSEGLMPAAKVIGNRYLWDRRAVENAFANLPDSTGMNTAPGVADGWD